MRQHADRGPRVDQPGTGLMSEVAIGPVHDNLVGHRKPVSRGEHRSRITHRHAVAGECRRMRDSGDEVGRAEDDQPRFGRQYAREDDVAVGAGQRPAGGQRVRAAHHGVVQRADAEAALHRSVGDHQLGAATRRSRSRRADERGQDSGLAPVGGFHGELEFRDVRRADPLDENIDRSAAQQADSEHRLIAGAVADQPRLARGQHLESQLVHRALHATATDGADDATIARHEHRRTRPARR